MAGNNPALRIVATGEIVTVAKWRARRMIAAGRAVLIGGDDAPAETGGSADRLAADPVKPAASKRGKAAKVQP